MNNTDFRNVPVTSQPVYTWLWNGAADDKETARQIDKMYEAGIRGFYIIAEPENFRPNLRRTFLKPDYLSAEYFDRVYFA